MKGILIKILESMGLTTLERQRLAEQRANELDEYARLVTAEASESGDMVIAGDYTLVRDVCFASSRRLIVPPWVSNTMICGCYFGLDVK